MKILIVAHPDDEIIWFPPEYFDHIFIAFLGRHDIAKMRKNRLRTLKKHPLRKKITTFGIMESGFWSDETRLEFHEKAKKELLFNLLKIKATVEISEIFTHNERGEYGHVDHILVHETVNQVFGNSVDIWFPKIFLYDQQGYIPKYSNQRCLSRDVKLYSSIKSIYDSQEAWTWLSNDENGNIQTFYKK